MVWFLCYSTGIRSFDKGPRIQNESLESEIIVGIYQSVQPPCVSPRNLFLGSLSLSYLNILRPRQTCRHFADDILKWIFLNENVWLLLNISLKFVPKVQINNILAFVKIMVWRRPGDKLLYEPMMVSLLTHICVTRPQWVNFCLSIYQNAIYICYTFTRRWVWQGPSQSGPFGCGESQKTITCCTSSAHL